MDLSRLETLVTSYPLESQTSWYAVDASVWPRCDAETSPDRVRYYHPYRHSHGSRSSRIGTIRGWFACRDAAQVGPRRAEYVHNIPGENIKVVAAQQIRSWLRQAPPTIGLPAVTFDAGYDSAQPSSALADLPINASAAKPAQCAFRAQVARRA
jgi:hypothetical protein